MTSRLICWLWLAVAGAMHASALPARPYTIELPDHLLHFSLPEEMAREMSPTQVETRFAPHDSAFLRDGFRVLASQLHDFDGPVWIGAYGSLKFTFSRATGSSRAMGSAEQWGAEQWGQAEQWEAEQWGQALGFGVDGGG